MLVVIVSIGTFLRLYRLGSNSLWLDETISVWFANCSLGDTFLMQLSRDVHPPFYYLILSLWIKAFGSGEFQVRLLSAIFGVLSIPLLYIVAKNLFGNLTASISAFALSISPFHIYYSQEARMYSLLTFFVILSMFFMVKMLSIGGEREEGRRTSLYSAGYVISTTAALYCHNIALFLPVAQNIFFVTFWMRHKPLLKIWILSELAILVLWSPWSLLLFRQSSMVQRGFYASPLTLKSIYSVFAAFNNGPVFWLFDWMDVGYPVIQGKLVLLAFIFFGALFLIGVLSMRYNPRSLVFLLLTFFVPVAAEILISLKRPILATQTLIWASVPYYILVSRGIVGLKNRWAFAMGIALIIVFDSGALYKYYTGFEKERWDLAARYVAENSDKNDLILFSSGFGQVPFDYYFGRYDNLNIEERGVPEDLTEKRVALENLPRLEKLIQGHKRIWLIYSHEWFTDPQRLSKATLEKSYCLLKERSFKSGQNTIVCYLFKKCEM